MRFFRPSDCVQTRSLLVKTPSRLSLGVRLSPNSYASCLPSQSSINPYVESRERNEEAGTDEMKTVQGRACNGARIEAIGGQRQGPSHIEMSQASLQYLIPEALVLQDALKT